MEPHGRAEPGGAHGEMVLSMVQQDTDLWLGGTFYRKNDGRMTDVSWDEMVRCFMG